MSLTVNQKEIVAKLKEEFEVLNAIEATKSVVGFFDFSAIDALKKAEQKKAGEIKLQNELIFNKFFTDFKDNVTKLKAELVERGFVVEIKLDITTKDTWNQRCIVSYDGREKFTILMAEGSDFINLAIGSVIKRISMSYRVKSPYTEKEYVTFLEACGKDGLIKAIVMDTLLKD